MDVFERGMRSRLASQTSDRSTCGHDCPECARNNIRNIKLSSLAEGRPDLVAEWGEERNGFPASSVTCDSHLKALWCELEDQGS
jgi:hypothetical protein